MLRELEIIIVQIVGWFYTLPYSVGLMTLGIGCIACILTQLFITGNTPFGKSFIPGIVGVFLFVAELLHLVSPEKVLNRVDSLLELFSTPRNGLSPIPVIEPLVSFFIAPLETRFILEESLFVFVCGYLFLVGRHSFN
jgi:hypothetical protein